MRLLFDYLYLSPYRSTPRNNFVRTSASREPTLQTSETSPFVFDGCLPVINRVTHLRFGITFCCDDSATLLLLLLTVTLAIAATSASLGPADQIPLLHWMLLKLVELTLRRDVLLAGLRTLRTVASCRCTRRSRFSRRTAAQLGY